MPGMRRDSTALGRTEVFSREEVEALARRIFDKISNVKAVVSISSAVGTTTQFARGDAHMSSESAGASVSLSLLGADRRASVSTTRYDDVGLKVLIAEAEATARQWHGTPGAVELLGPQVYKQPPKLFFEQNLPLMAPDGRAAICDAALDATEAAGLIGAGDINVYRSSWAILDTDGLFGYSANTYAEFSLTARTKDGRGSGWRWSGHENWARIDSKAVIAAAVDLAQRSATPVAVEPGRYTVILEPAAVASLISGINFDAWAADNGYTPFARELKGANKIGLQMMDARLEMVSDPWDSEAPSSTVGGNGEPLDKVQWFTEGVLRELHYSREYAREKRRLPTFPPGSLRLYSTGEPQSLEEMIASTKRGVWVNRLSNVIVLNDRTLLMTGTTRDGTFLIENGRITKAIKNFRFTESPFFVLNKLEAAGTPIRASSRIIAPRLKVRDFEFSSLTDAV
jgi:predicted Zn-dependent protease